MGGVLLEINFGETYYLSSDLSPPSKATLFPYLKPYVKMIGPTLAQRIIVDSRVMLVSVLSCVFSDVLDCTSVHFPRVHLQHFAAEDKRAIDQATAAAAAAKAQAEAEALAAAQAQAQAASPESSATDGGSKDDFLHGVC